MKFEIPEKKKLVHESIIPIRWGDMDAMGHLNNGSYLRYLETSRIDWLHGIGCVPDDGKNKGGIGIVIINVFCSFHDQLKYPGHARVKMYASDPGRSSFETWATIEREDEPGKIYASGGATTVWMDFSSNKSVPMPEWFRPVVTP